MSFNFSNVFINSMRRELSKLASEPNAGAAAADKFKKDTDKEVAADKKKALEDELGLGFGKK